MKEQDSSQMRTEGANSNADVTDIHAEAQRLPLMCLFMNSFIIHLIPKMAWVN